MDARWEFRVFGGCAETARDALQRHGAGVGEVEERTDTYLVGSACDVSLKLKRDALDLKRLVDRRGALELWEPAGSAPLPLDADRLVRCFIHPARLDLDPGEGSVDAPRLLALAAAAGLQVVPVEKRRTRCRIGTALAELTRLRIDGRFLWSVAVEDSDPAPVEEGRERLGLGGSENVSYQCLLVGRVARCG